MNTGVVMPFRARFVVPDRGTYDIAQAQCTFSATGIPVASVVIATGTGEHNGPQAITFRRGDAGYIEIDEASITVDGGTNVYGSLVKAEFRLFRGVIDDFGPVELKPGIFTIQVQLFGTTVWLNTGTLNSSAVKPNQYTDLRINLPSQCGSYFSRFQIRYRNALADFGVELRNVFDSIATSTESPAGSITQTLLEYFDLPGNTKVAETIEEIVPNLLWRVIEDGTGADITPQIVDSVIQRLNEDLTYDWFMESYLTKIQKVGGTLSFALIENGSGIKMVPYQPFFRSVDAYPILPETYTSAQWVQNNWTNYQGCALMSGPGASTDINNLIVGKYKRPGSPMGLIHVAEAPSILLRENWQGQHGESPDPGDVARGSIGDVGNLGDRFAKLLTWNFNYSNRTIRVSCPFLRGDIGLLTAVRVDFPNTPDIGFAIGTPAMYGSVQSVTVYLDGQGAAWTTYDVGYVRSYQQQENEIDPDLTAGEHPFFNTSYIGGRLDSSESRPVTAVSTAQ